MLKDIIEKVLDNQDINYDEALSLIDCDIEELKNGADLIRKHFCSNKFDLCSIINGKSGKCSEDCKFCRQSIHYNTNVETYDLLDSKMITNHAKTNEIKGVQRFSIVTSGRNLSCNDFNKLIDIYQTLKQKTKLSLCASLGLLNEEQFKQLKALGVVKYHNNLETSRNYFKYICSTHSYQQKIDTINSAKKAGLQICSGGIIGMGESWQDRVDLAFELKNLNITSIPINILNPIANTPLENTPPLSKEDLERTFAIFRFINPHAIIKLAGGRTLLDDSGFSIFKSGANGAITGDMLTTKGIEIDNDLKMIKELGFEVIKTC